MLPVRLANLKIYEIIPVSFPSKRSNTSMSMILIHDYIKYIFLTTQYAFLTFVSNRFRPRAGEAELLIVGRIFVVVLVGVAIVWIPIIQVLNHSADLAVMRGGMGKKASQGSQRAL